MATETSAPPAPGYEDAPGPSPEERRRTEGARQAEVLRRMAPTSLEAHARLVHRDDANRPIVASDHHAEWIRILEDRDDKPWVCVVAPPGYAKSTWFSTIYPTWRIGQQKGRIRLGLVSNAAGQASAFVQTVGDAIESDPFRAAYPGVEPDKKRGWSRGHLWTRPAIPGPNPTLLSSGIGGVSVLGKRFDEIILDDPTTWENARSDSVMDGQRHFLKSTLLSRFPPGMGPPGGSGGRMAVVCTRWSERDLVPTLAEVGFEVIRMPALGYWDRTPHDPADPDGDFEPGGLPLWPERESLAQLLELKDEDELVFELVYQGNPAVLKGDFFDPNWWRYTDPPKREELDRVICYVDTATGRSRQKGDFFVIATVGRRPSPIDGRDPEYHVMGVYRRRIPTTRHVNAVLDQCEEHQCREVIVEDSNEGRALYDALRKGTNLKVKPYVPTKDKEYRAEPVANEYRRGNVYHPHPEERAWVRTLEAEMEGFPEAEYDDQVDGIAGAFNGFGRGRARLRLLG